MSMCRLIATTFVACALLHGCSKTEHTPPTQILVAITSDLNPETELSRIETQVTTRDGSHVVATRGYDVVAASPKQGQVVLPLTFSVGKGREDSFLLTVTGHGPLDATQNLVEYKAIAAFVENKTLLLRVFLGRVCLKTSCADDLVCHPSSSALVEAGECGAASEYSGDDLPSGDIDQLRDLFKTPPEGVVVLEAGADQEGGVLDAGLDGSGDAAIDAGPRDSLDGSGDAAIDAGPRDSGKIDAATAPDCGPMPADASSGIYLSPAGACQPIATECYGKKDGDTVCRGLDRVRCGADLFSVTPVDTCNYVCSEGSCIGVCVPTAKQCRGLVPQTCDANGAWQSDPVCAHMCVNGACAGACTPGATQCSGSQFQSCSVEGQWATPTACAWPNPTCVGIACTSTALTVLKSGTGGGSVASVPAGIDCGSTCSALSTALSSTPIVLTATADTTSDFTGWSGECTGTGTCSVDLAADTTVTATFTKKRFALTAAKSGATTNGTVTSIPSGINCGVDCSETYDIHTSVVLTATPDNLAYFTGWSGGGCTSTGNCTVTLTEALTVTAAFALRPNTGIDRKPPPASNMTTVTVEFSSTQLASTFECALNGGAAAACLSPKSFALTTNATNTISVTAINAAGQRDLSPAIVSVRQTPTNSPIVQYDFANRITNVSAVTPGLYNGAGQGFTYTGGKFGQCVKFASANNPKLTFAGTLADLWKSTSPDWTISLWWKEDAPAKANSQLFSIRGNDGGWETYHGATSPVSSMTSCGGGCDSFTNPTVGAWHSLVYRYNAPSYLSGGPVQIYSDGVLIATLTNAGALDLLTQDAADLVLGAHNTAPGYASDFYVDEVRIFDTVFTDAIQCTTVIGGTWVNPVCTLP